MATASAPRASALAASAPLRMPPDGDEAHLPVQPELPQRLPRPSRWPGPSGCRCDRGAPPPTLPSPRPCCRSRPRPRPPWRPAFTSSVTLHAPSLTCIGTDQSVASRSCSIFTARSSGPSQSGWRAGLRWSMPVGRSRISAISSSTLTPISMPPVPGLRPLSDHDLDRLGLRQVVRVEAVPGRQQPGRSASPTPHARGRACRRRPCSLPCRSSSPPCPGPSWRWPTARRSSCR